MEQIFAADIMVPIDKYPCLQEEDTLRDAIHKMDTVSIESNGQISLPRFVLVFNKKKQLRGFVRRRDILRGLEPAYAMHKKAHVSRRDVDIAVDTRLLAISYGNVEAIIRKKAGHKIEEVVQPIRATVNHDGNLLEIISKMVESNCSMMPVMKDGSVIGVIRSVDVLSRVIPIVK